MQYREPLPPDCPPPGASAIMERTVRYRLLETTTPQLVDFDSYVKRKGGVNRRIPRTPCEQSGLSLYATYSAARRELGKGRYNKRGRRWQSIGELTLSPGAGKLNPVAAHDCQTWWPSRDFNPAANCEATL